MGVQSLPPLWCLNARSSHSGCVDDEEEGVVPERQEAADVRLQPFVPGAAVLGSTESSRLLLQVPHYQQQSEVKAIRKAFPHVLLASVTEEMYVSFCPLLHVDIRATLLVVCEPWCFCPQSLCPSSVYEPDFSTHVNSRHLHEARKVRAARSAAGT